MHKTEVFLIEHNFIIQLVIGRLRALCLIPNIVKKGFTQSACLLFSELFYAVVFINRSKIICTVVFC